MNEYMIFLCVSLIVILSGCTTQTDNDFKSIDAYSCSIDSDCEVKDVHNCCGYFPRCVNKDYIPDIDAVKNECQETGLESVCGWSDISHCKCFEDTCISMQGDSVV